MVLAGHLLLPWAVRKGGQAVSSFAQPPVPACRCHISTPQQAVQGDCFTTTDVAGGGGKPRRGFRLIRSSRAGAAAAAPVLGLRPTRSAVDLLGGRWAGAVLSRHKK